MKIRCMHELSKTELPEKEHGYADFGLRLVRDEMQHYFNNDPLQSKMTLDLECIFEDEKYYTEFVNKNSLKLQICSL